LCFQARLINEGLEKGSGSLWSGQLKGTQWPCGEDTKVESARGWQDCDRATSSPRCAGESSAGKGGVLDSSLSRKLARGVGMLRGDRDDNRCQVVKRRATQWIVKIRMVAIAVSSSGCRMLEGGKKQKAVVASCASTLSALTKQGFSNYKAASRRRLASISQICKS